MREVKDKNRLHAYSKKQLLRLIVELCRGFTTPPHGTKHMVEHISPHSNKDAIVEFIHSTIAVELDKNKKECPICYDTLGRTKCRTSCGHDMCTGCFTRIFTTNPLHIHVRCVERYYKIIHVNLAFVVYSVNLFYILSPLR